MTYHHLLGPNDAHSIHSWVYATLTDRDNHNPSEGGTDPITAEDVSLKRVCYVTSTGTFHYLKALGPPVEWGDLGGGAGGGVIPESLVEFNGFGHDHSGGTAGAPITLGSLSGLDSFIREIHEVTAAEVAAGYFYLDHGYTLDPQSVFLSIVNGVTQVNDWSVAGPEVVPDFGVLLDYPDRVYINNNAEAYGLSGDIVEGDILIVSYIGTASPFVMEWEVAGDEAARTISLPLVEARAEGALAYDFTADWGDGSTSNITAWDDTNATHIFAADGRYRVKISGTMEGWSFNNGGDCLKIRRIINWGGAPYFDGFKYLKGAFYGCTNLISLGFGKIPARDTGVLTDGFANVFTNCSGIVKLPVGIFDNHPNVTVWAFSDAFSGCSNLKYVPRGLFKNHSSAEQYMSFQSLFYNCTSLEWIPEDLFANIPLLRGAFQMFKNCTSLKVIPADLFKFNPMIASFQRTFEGCSSITSIPLGLFDTVGIEITSFNRTFAECDNLVDIPEDLFKYNTAVAASAFYGTFRYCPSLVTIPAGLFQYAVLAGANAFRDTFMACTSLASIPADLFRYNTLVADTAFQSTFSQCDALVSVPADLFRYNVLVGNLGFYATFWDCELLATIPAGLFRYNTLATFENTFERCDSLQMVADLFYNDGEQMTRFLDVPVSNFYMWIDRGAFTGVQGEAPDLWNCDFGETITLDVAPATDWDPGDIITGQTSLATAEVVFKVSATEYRIYKHLGDFTLDEIVGVTGIPGKLADQGAAFPVFDRRPVITNCFAGAGNSAASLSNYADIPSDWK